MRLEVEPRVAGVGPDMLGWMRRVAQAVSAAAVVKGATAGRPTLGATDIGVLYLDTTLAAAGKPIWWTGTAWVDATGTTV